MTIKFFCFVGNKLSLRTYCSVIDHAYTRICEVSGVHRVHVHLQDEEPRFFSSLKIARVSLPQWNDICKNCSH